MKNRVIALILTLVSVFGFAGCGAKKQKTFVWDEVLLASKLPDPETDVGHLSYNSEDHLYIYDIPCTQAQWNSYVQRCRDMGFTIDEDKDATSFRAFNSEGYEISTYISSYSEEMSLSLDAPMEMGTLSWPRNGLAQMLPAAPTERGKISTDRSDSLHIYAADMDRDAFRVYVDQCADAGFTVDYDSGEDYYRARNSEDYELRLSYAGFNIVEIDLDAPEEAETEAPAVQTEEPAKTEETPAPTEQAAAGVRAEFKKTLDDYEAFFNEYAEFMKSYNSSSSSMDQLSAYLSMLSRYSDAMTALDELSEEEMSDAELIYYMEVMSRISAKLLEAAG